MYWLVSTVCFSSNIYDDFPIDERVYLYLNIKKKMKTHYRYYYINENNFLKCLWIIVLMSNTYILLVALLQPAAFIDPVTSIMKNTRKLPKL